MNTNPEIVSALQKLATGELAADQWLQWWEANSEFVASQLNRGQWLRLRPPEPDDFGPPCRCALVSQQGAIKLLSSWGVEHRPSNRYEQEWEAAFEQFQAAERQKREAKQAQLLPRLESLKTDFPKLAKFLRRNLDEIEALDEPASEEQIAQLEASLAAKLPASYRRFLLCTSGLAYGESTRIGLNATFRHPNDPDLPTANQICFGEHWLEGDGDQVLFGEAEANEEPPILYYNHAKPSCHVLAANFQQWAESLPKTLNG